MNLFDAIKNDVKSSCEESSIAGFFRSFLRSYGIPNATLVRANIVENLQPDDVIKISNKICLTYTLAENLYAKFDELQRTVIKNQTYRFVFLRNASNVLALDTGTNEWLDTSIDSLYKDSDFFLPLKGIERVAPSSSQITGIKVGEKLAEIYNTVRILNPADPEAADALLVSLVASFMAEGGNLIVPGTIKRFISLYGRNAINELNPGLKKLFYALHDNSGINDDILAAGVIGSIANLKPYDADLQLNQRVCDLILELCDFDWSDIEPEVLGSIVQTIVTPDEAGVAYNYTSTANIYKVIGPLFIDDLYTNFEKAKRDGTLSPSFLYDIENLRFLDPSCGTGNFLIVTFRELKKLELKVKEFLIQGGTPFEGKEYVTINQFFGIERNPLAVYITQLGLTFAAAKTDHLASELFLPTENILNISALKKDWNELCNKVDHRVFIFGNPSYKGARGQSAEQQSELQYVFSNQVGNGMKIGDLDYASAYFYKAAEYISGTSGAFAFVTTNSLTQGIHVPTLWPAIFSRSIDISFAYTSFKWKNSGRNNTAVTVVIIGCRASNNPHPKTLYDGNHSYDAQDISPYLTRGNAIVQKENRGPICAWLPKMIKGNMPYGKGLLLSPIEKDTMLSLYPEAEKYLKRVVGSQEFIHGEERWCLWISDEEAEEAVQIPLIAERVDSVREARLQGDSSAIKLAARPYSFREAYMPQKYTLVVPSVSSENRSYFQIGYVGKDTVVTNLSFVIYDAEPWVFGVIASKMHNLWIRTVCGGLETRPRYSNVLGYNTFPIPRLSEEQKRAITEAVYSVIMEREIHSEMSLMELYNDDTMPEGLLYAHKTLDLAIEKCYKPEGFSSDQERLDAMFLLYKQIKGV